VEHSRWETRVAIITVLVFGLALSAVLLFALMGTTPAGTQISTATTAPPTQPVTYPLGTVNPSEPSGLGPPPPTALSGYHRTYTTDFPGAALPPGWETFKGIPGGDPTAQFASSHVIVGNGMLRLVTYRDAEYAHKWTSGGLCQCGHPMTYGAFFVRSKISNAGPNEVELLWPANNQWPPEIDFNESGARWNDTSATVHHGTFHNDQFVQQNFPNINLRQWHTWGVVWTPTSIMFIIDGRQWGTTLTAPVLIPQLPMTLDLQQRPGCPSYETVNQACPPQDQAMYVDWVAEYARNTP
jgi:Glycosyl hydrolases family 16